VPLSPSYTSIPSQWNSAPKVYDDLWHGQSFGFDETEEWSVPELITWAENNAEHRRLPVAHLAADNLDDDSGQADEPLDSPEFHDRAMASSLEYPIIVIRDGDGLTVADGLHRLFKARELGEQTISAYVIDREDLQDIPRQMQRESGHRKSNLLI